MDIEALPAAQWEQLSELVAAHCGLHFPAARHEDLARGLESAARTAGVDAPTLAAELLREPARPGLLQQLVEQLTVGETYFFREKPAFSALGEQVLPALIEQRRQGARSLRLWSAACSTGEEAYSLAMLVDRLLPGRDGWHIDIIGSDLNATALGKAREGVYGEWSFRGVAPGLRERYFHAAGARSWRIDESIRAMVSFRCVNLAEGGFHGPGSALRGMDVILCRNLLIYFTPQHARRLVAGLGACLADDGWLVVSPSECSQTLFADFATVNHADCILYRRPQPPAARRESAQVIEAATPAPTPAPPLPPARTLEEALADAQALATLGRHGEAARLLESALPRAGAGDDTRVLRLLTQALANHGERGAALSASERWLAADRMDPAAHYFHALVLQELGERARARAAFQRAIYLLPDFTLAHVSLGNCARAEARHEEARRHYQSAARLLARQPAEQPVAGADGLSAGRLRDIVSSLLAGPP